MCCTYDAATVQLAAHLLAVRARLVLALAPPRRPRAVVRPGRYRRAEPGWAPRPARAGQLRGVPARGRPDGQARSAAAAARVRHALRRRHAGRAPAAGPDPG